MGVANYQELMKHYGHKISVVRYSNVNVAIECEDCCEILLDFDKKGVKKK